MSTIATLAIKLVGDTTQLKASFDEAAGTVQRAGQTMASVGAVVSGAVTAPLVGLGMTAIKVASDQEQLQIAFSTMLGDADRAKQLMEDLAQFAATTPFELPEVTGAAKQLMAFGVEAEDVQTVLGRLGNLAAGVGAPVGELAYLFGTSRVQGRLFAADINQFTGRGIPLIEALAATMGVATTEIRGMVEDGTVGFAELDAALAYLTEDGGKFAGLMEAQSQSLQGLFSTAKDNVMLTLGEIGKVAIREFDLTPKLRELIAVLELIRANVGSFAAENPKLFTSLIMVGVALAAVGPALTALGAAMMFIAPALTAVGAVIAALVSPVGLVVAAVVALGVAWVKNVGGIRTATMQALAPIQERWSALVAAFDAGRFSLVGVFGELASHLVTLNLDTYDTTDNIWEFIRALTGSAEAATVVADAVWAGYEAMGAFRQYVSDVVALAGAGLPEFGASVQRAFGLIVAAASSLAAGKSSIGAFVESVTAAFAGIDWAPVAAKFDWLKEQIGAGIDAIKNYDYAGAAAGMRDALVGAFNSIDWSSVTASVSQIGDNVVTVVTGIDWAAAFGAVTDAANGMRDAVIGWITGGISGIDWSKASLDLAGFVNGIVTKIRTIDWSQVNPVTLFLPLVGRLVPGIGQAIGTASWVISSENFSALVQSIIDAVRAIDWGTIGEALAGLVTAVKDALLGLDWASLAESATTIQEQISGLFAGMKVEMPGVDLSGLTAGLSVVQEIMAPAFDRLREAMSTLPASLAELQPSIDGLTGAFGGLMTAIQPIVAVLGVGLVWVANFGVNALAAAINNLPGIVGPIIDQISATINMLSGTVSGVTGAIAAIAAGDWPAAWESLKGVVTGFGDFVAETVGRISEQWSAVAGALGEASGNAMTDLGLEDVAASVQAILGNMTALGEKIAQVFTGELSLSAAAPEWLTTLLAWVWPTMTSPAWITNLLGWIWPTLTSPGWVTTLLAWAWPAFISLPGWVDGLVNWSWPALPQPGWIGNLFSFEWPSLQMPGWLQQFFPQNALGTSYFQGGLTLVGETGPEVVALPRGSQIYPAGESKRMLAGGGGEGIVIQNVTVQNEVDMYELLHKLEDMQRRRR
ncbi:MAG: tape measure protein [Dokdonella sp.]